MSLNKAMIIGNLGRDPEMRYTPNGQAVTQFTVAVNRNYKDSSGEWKDAGLTPLRPWEVCILLVVFSVM